MLKSICLLTAIGTLQVCCGCVAIVAAPGAKYAFELDFEDETPEASQVREYAVLSQTAQMREAAIDGPEEETSCTYKMLPNRDSRHTLAYTVPPRFGSVWMVIPFVPETSVFSWPDHAFTVFSPGYVATTVYPIGVYDDLESDWKKRTTSGTAPAIDDGGPPKWTKDDSGVYRGSLAIERLPEHATATKEDVDLFDYQLARLAAAITQGSLDRVNDATRKLVYKAVEQQHACCTSNQTKWKWYLSDRKGSHLSSFDECSQQEGSPCEIITAWAMNKELPQRKPTSGKKRTLDLGCLSITKVPGADYAFSVQCEDSARPPAAYAVLREVRAISDNTADKIDQHSRLTRLESTSDAVITYDVPERTVTERHAFVGPWRPTIGTHKTNHRFTVFAPGYAAVTVYPLGYKDAPPQNPADEDAEDGPGTLDAHGISGDIDKYPGGNPLGYTKGDDGVFHSVLPLKPVPPKPTHHDARLFRYQLTTLIEAIREGRLDHADTATRELVYEAVKAQHDCFKNLEPQWRWSFFGDADTHLDSFDDCIHHEKSPCKILAEWARKKPD